MKERILYIEEKIEKVCTAALVGSTGRDRNRKASKVTQLCLYVE